MNREILRLALPNIVTNITVPLLGMVDLMIVGHMPHTSYIGAIAIATMIFNMIYWIFGFLRMGTSGFTAQSYGSGDMEEAGRVLCRSFTVGLAIALILLLLQNPILSLTLSFVEGSEELKAIASRYYFINIWAAPAVLSLYSLKGWFIGMQNSRLPMFIAITINVVNICMSLLFVIVLKMDIEGVALGTLLAQYSGLAMALWFLVGRYSDILRGIDIKGSLVWLQMKRFFSVNADIFLRTICLVAVFSFFPIAGSIFGDDILALNTLLMQFFTIFSYIMDGFAYAGEALSGRFIGERSPIKLRKSIRGIFLWGVILTAVFTLVYATFGHSLLGVFTDKADIILLAKKYYFWVLLIPISGFSAFLFDGIFIGATSSRHMLYAIAVATLVFFATYYSLSTYLGNNSLWLSLLLFLLLRGLLQWAMLKRGVYAKC